MHFMKIAGVCALAGLVLGANALSASADPFATFKQGDNGVTKPFNYNVPALAGQDNFNVISIPVTFSYTVANGYDGTNNIAAHLTLTADVDTTAAHGSAAGFNFEGIVFRTGDVLSITADVAVGGKKNLLTIGAGTTGILEGTNKGHNVALSGDDVNNIVNMTSDFVTLSGYSLSYNVSFNTVPAITDNSTGFIKSFVAVGSGEFGRESLTPEGSAIGMLSAAVLPLAGIGLGLRRRKVSKN